MERRPRIRACKPKVRTGCITCKVRRVKCDEGKPSCHRCESTKRQCEGYSQPEPSALSQELGLSSTKVSDGESRALEFFFQATCHQLAGFLDGDFWERSVLQFSLSEPSIRQAMAAIGSLHQHETSCTASDDRHEHKPALAGEMYSRAIRSVVVKAATGQTAVPVVVMASILFTSFEFLRGDSAAATIHIANGIKLLQSWRESTQLSELWGRKYPTYEAQFMDSELAPILTLFSINASEFSPFPPTRLILNRLEDGGPKLPERFETLREARVALVDLITVVAMLLQNLDSQMERREPLYHNVTTPSQKLQLGFERWKTMFRDLTLRCQPTWKKGEKSAANVIQMMQYGSEMGLMAYLVSSECDWDSRREDFEQIIELAETIITESRSGETPNLLNVEIGLVYPMHAVAWKCRYPRLRRKALDLLLQSSRREWLHDTRQYHAIFSRIMEIEEESLHSPDAVPHDDALLPEHARVHDFHCRPQPHASGDSRHTVTFVMKPYGLNGPWHFKTESMSLPSFGSDTMAPTNLISLKPWASPYSADPETSNELKGILFGSNLTNRFR